MNHCAHLTIIEDFVILSNRREWSLTCRDCGARVDKNRAALLGGFDAAIAEQDLQKELSKEQRLEYYRKKRLGNLARGNAVLRHAQVLAQRVDLQGVTAPDFKPRWRL
jgi:hypothetical protein